jgi:hypothetical protein
MSSMDRIAREAAATYGPQPTTPAEALAHVLCAYAQEPDDHMVVTATNGIYGPGVRTGLTVGDLRSIQQQLDAIQQPTDADVVPFSRKR